MSPPAPLTPNSPVALVTGAGRRIGRAIALALAESGWRIAVHFGTSQAAAEQTVADIVEQGGLAAAFGCDLADEADTGRLVQRVARHFGRIDAVINNAGRFEYDDAETFSAASLNAHIAPNLVAPVILARDLAAAMKQRGDDARGVVINLLDQKL